VSTIHESRLFRVESSSAEGSARTGTLFLPHGEVETPAFMPVGTAGAVKALHHSTLEQIGYSLILGNTYHLYLRPGLEVFRKYGGLHQFSGWNGNILTDSGGYQVFSLEALRKISDDGVLFQSHIDGSRHHFSPESVVQAQVAFNSDIQMALDVCTAPDIPYKEAETALEITSRWARRAADEWHRARAEGYQGVLFPIVQGNFFHDLRKRSVEEIASLELPGIAIGGLSVGETAEQFREFLFETASQLQKHVPHYLMGIGTPDYIFDAVSAGMDMFDCVFPTRIARNGTVLTADGRLVLKSERLQFDSGPIEEGCDCHACRTYSRGFLRHLFKAGELLGPMLATEHNLVYLARLMQGIRDSIRDGAYESHRRTVLQRYEAGERERLGRR
jgi:queuine tRNA-ribosyltransferase